MNPITIFFRGIWDTFRLFRMWLLLFLLIFVLALTVAVPFANVMEASVGNSLELSKLLPQYDHTVWSDFMNAHGDKITGIFNQVRWMLPLFLLLYIFLSGGIVKSFDSISEGFSGRRFMSACTYYFWRFFRLFFWLMLIQGLLALLIYRGAFLALLGNDWGNLRSEDTLINAGKILIPIHLFLATFLAMVADYTKVRMVKNDTWWALPEFARSFEMCVRYFFRTYLPYLLDILLLVGIYALYLFVADKIGMAGKVAIGLMVAIQTLVMFFRLGTRLFALGSANRMYDAIQRKENPIEENNVVSDTLVAPVPVAADSGEEDDENDDFDEEDQQYNEREDIIDWSPYLDEQQP